MDDLPGAGLLEAVFDALPVPAFVVDADVRILARNPAARALLGDGPGAPLTTRAGEALHCMNAANDFGGCGHSEACRTCVVRGAVGETLRGGAAVRRPQHMRASAPGGPRDLYVLVTTARLREEPPPRALLLLQDISELVSVQGLVGVCMHCRRVRQPSGAWEPMEYYLKANLDVDVSHGLCPDCLETHYPDHAGAVLGGTAGGGGNGGASPEASR